MKVLVLGQGRSGTTALTKALTDAIDPSALGLVFEPRDLNEVNFSRDPIVCKKLIDTFREDERGRFEHFDKTILIVRDPRDNLISRALYMVYRREAFNDDAMADRYFRVVRQKRQERVEFPFRLVVETFEEITGINLEREVSKLNAKTELLWSAVKERFHMLRYEDFVSGRLDAINEYLGVSIVHDVKVYEEFKRVERAKRHSDYLAWFTAGDLAYYNKLFAQFLSAFDYPMHTTASQDDHVAIDPREAELYMANVISDGRIRHGGSPYVPVARARQKSL